VIACYLELYEECEVNHINGVWPQFQFNSLIVGSNHTHLYTHVQTILKNSSTQSHHWPFASIVVKGFGRVGH